VVMVEVPSSEIIRGETGILEEIGKNRFELK
jgi:hypothetical protein